MATVPKSIYRVYGFNATPIKIPTQILSLQTTLSFVWKNKKPRLAKTILYNKYAISLKIQPSTQSHFKVLEPKAHGF